MPFAPTDILSLNLILFIRLEVSSERFVQQGFQERLLSCLVSGASFVSPFLKPFFVGTAVLHMWNRVNVDVEHLIQVQLALECIKVNADSFLERVPCPNPDDIGVLQVYRSGNEYFIYFRADVRADVVKQICSFSPKTIFHIRSRIGRMLAEAFRGIVARAFHILSLSSQPEPRAGKGCCGG